MAFIHCRINVDAIYIFTSFIYVIYESLGILVTNLFPEKKKEKKKRNKYKKFI